MSPLYILKTETFTFGKKVMNICDTLKYFLEYADCKIKLNMQIE